jgi:hypothetical protein
VTREYEAPKLRELGSLEELTEQSLNKVGPTPDAFTSNPDIIGSLTPFP